MSEWRPLGAVMLEVDEGADGMVDMYTVEGGGQYEVRPPRRQWSVHPHNLPLPQQWESGRQVERHRCDCRAGTTLVRVMALADGNLWAFIEPERIPKSMRREGRMDDTLAAPLHTDGQGAPHMQVTGCRRCSARWLTLLYEDEVRLLRLHLAAHKVTPVPD